MGGVRDENGVKGAIRTESDGGDDVWKSFKEVGQRQASGAAGEGGTYAEKRTGSSANDALVLGLPMTVFLTALPRRSTLIVVVVVEQQRVGTSRPAINPGYSFYSWHCRPNSHSIP